MFKWMKTNKQKHDKHNTNSHNNKNKISKSSKNNQQEEQQQNKEDKKHKQISQEELKDKNVKNAGLYSAGEDSNNIKNTSADSDIEQSINSGYNSLRRKKSSTNSNSVNLSQTGSQHHSCDKHLKTLKTNQIDSQTFPANPNEISNEKPKEFNNDKKTKVEDTDSNNDSTDDNGYHEISPNAAGASKETTYAQRTQTDSNIYSVQEKTPQIDHNGRKIHDSFSRINGGFRNSNDIPNSDNSDRNADDSDRNLNESDRNSNYTAHTDNGPRLSVSAQHLAGGRTDQSRRSFIG